MRVLAVALILVAGFIGALALVGAKSLHFPSAVVGGAPGRRWLDKQQEWGERYKRYRLPLWGAALALWVAGLAVLISVG